MPRHPFFRLAVSLLVVLASLGVSVAHAELKVNPERVDFGKARQEQSLTTTITLTNTGPKSVEILRVGADCSCTAASSKTGSLGPGESTTIDVKLETRTYQQELVRHVLVQTSGGDVMIPVRALVSAFDDWNLNQAMAVFAASNKGTEAQASMTVSYIGKGQAEVTSAKATVPWISVAVEKLQDGAKLVLTKKADAPAGNHQPKIMVSTTDPHEPEISFNVFVSVYSNLNVKPNPMLLPVTQVGKTVSIPFTLSMWEAKVDPRFEIDGGEGKVSQRDRSEVLASLSVTPKSSGTATRLLRIYAGDELEAEVPVIIRAE